ncbi:MAG: methyl-accepting chemotaxis protein [Candidatus Acidiferrum sp.]
MRVESDYKVADERSQSSSEPSQGLTPPRTQPAGPSPGRDWPPAPQAAPARRWLPSMRNTRISARLPLAFSVVLLFLLCVAAAGVWATRKISADTLKLLQTDAKLEQKYAAARTYSVELRRYEKDTLLNFDNKSAQDNAIDNWKTTDQRLHESISDLDQIAVKSDDTDALTTVKGALKDYEDGYQGMAAGIHSGQIKRLADGMVASAQFKDPRVKVEDTLQEQDAEHASRMADHEKTTKDISREALWTIVLATLVGFLVSAVISVVTARSVTGPINQAVDATQQILSGNLNPDIDTSGKDETGRLMLTVQKMAAEFKEKVTSMARITSMIDNAPINVMCADLDLHIRYMNQTSTRTMKQLQQYLPISVDQMIGHTIDVFHKNPEHQRQMLATDKHLPHNRVIQVGPESLNLLVSAVYDASRNYLGPMVTWEIVTQKLADEKAKKESQERDQEQSANVAAVNRVLEAVGRAASANEAARATLDTVKDGFGWAYGSYWVMDGVENALKFAVESGSVNEEFRRVTMEARFREGEGLSGRAWKNRDLFFIEDLAELKDCCRAPVAKRAGVKSGVAFPIMLAGQVVAMMDFFSLETLHPSAERLEALRNVGRVVSSAVERISATEREAKLAAELKVKVDSILDVVRAAARGDLTREVTVRGSDAVGQMGEGLSQFFTDLRASVTNIATNSQSLAAASEELSSNSQQMSANAEETSAQANVVSTASEQVNRNLQTVAAGTEEMSSSIKEISKNAGEAAKIATAAVKVAKETNATVAKLGESSAEIGQVIKVITTIAQQTNLLALNATIEAARAGESGKGFAVVANEVKELAKETAKATEDISRKIEAIQENTKEAVGAIGTITSIINQINEISTTIAASVDQQNVTTNEMARNVTEAANGAGEIVKNISGVAEAAQSTSHGAGDTQKAAASLALMSTELRGLVERFKY